MYCRKLITAVSIAAAGLSAAALTDVEIDELLSRMTLEEKVGQMVQVSSGGKSAAEAEDGSGRKIDAVLAGQIRNGEIGSLLGACGVKNFNAFQKIAVEESRLGIPLMVGHDMIHGVFTQLPIPLALSCAWDEELWRKGGELIARETPLKGANWTFTPMVDISRDPRWGRIAESAGQDALVASRMSAALVRGVQTKDVAHPIAACLKHFVGYGAAMSGRDYNEVEMSESTLRNVYLPPFAAGIDAGALTVMPAFHTFNGVPCSVNKWLLSDILRGELGFKGMTISDYNAVGECAWPDHHGVADGDESVSAMAVAAGMDQDMMGESYKKTLASAVKKGLVPEKAVDGCVRNILRVKNALGLFEKPYIDEAAAKAGVDWKADAALAREAAARSAVLLKNNGALPLKPGLKVALVGPGADDLWHTVGCWATWAENPSNPTLVDGLKADGVEFKYVKAYGFRGGKVDVAAIQSAAANADVVVACFGEQGREAGENNSRMDLSLPKVQLDAIDAIKATGKPFVAVLMNGRPLAIPELAEAADAILEAWNPGTSGGWGIADVLTGRINPSGRLTTEFPYATGQCPLYYNKTRTGRPHKEGERWTTRYIDGPYGALYPFGHGLTYTTFEYSDEKVVVDGDKLVFTAKIRNTGLREGVETVQAYTRQLVAVESRPVRELRGWKRVTLAPGEESVVAIEVPLANLDYWAASRKVAASGEFEAWIAPDSTKGKKLGFSIR